MPPFPFYNAYGGRQSKSHQRNKMGKWKRSVQISNSYFFLEWDHCQFHENCGEGNCCYAHFRFRSLPKSFCRPNRNNKNELCEPLTKYRSLKDVPAWKQQRQQYQWWATIHFITRHIIEREWKENLRIIKKKKKQWIFCLISFILTYRVFISMCQSFFFSSSNLYKDHRFLSISFSIQTSTNFLRIIVCLCL
jgi:hypothetical protein